MLKELKKMLCPICGKEMEPEGIACSNECIRILERNQLLNSLPPTYVKIVDKVVEEKAIFTDFSQEHIEEVSKKKYWGKGMGIRTSNRKPWYDNPGNLECVCCLIVMLVALIFLLLKNF